MAESPLTEQGPNRRRVLLLVGGAIVVVVAVAVFGVVRYGVYRLESRDLRNHGVELLNDGDVAAAEEALQVYHMRRPEDLPAALALARAKLARTPATSQRALEALALIDDVLRDNPNSREAKLLKLRGLQQSGQAEAAFELSRELHSAMPSQPLPLAVLTQGLMQRGQMAEAVSVAERAVNTALPQPGLRELAFDVLIEGNQALGRRDEAAKWARESLDFDPKSPARLERWAQAAPAGTDPEQWVRYAEEADPEHTTQGDVLRLVALQLAQRRAAELNRPEQARTYRAEFLSLLDRLSEASELSAEHAGLIARQLEVEGRYDDQARFLQRLARGEGAAHDHRLLWARQAFFLGQPANFAEARELIEPADRPAWLEGYAVLLARQQGDAAGAAAILATLSESVRADARVWRQVLDGGATPLARLRGLGPVWAAANDPVLLRLVAADLAAVGHDEAAATALLRATRAAPAWAAPYTDLARVFLALERWIAADELIASAFERGAPTAELDALRIDAADQQLERLSAEDLDAHLALLDGATGTDHAAARLRAWWVAGRDAEARSLAEAVIADGAAWPRKDTEAAALVGALQRYAPDLLDDMAARLPEVPDASPVLAARLAAAVAAQGRSRAAWAAFDAAQAEHPGGPATLDWAVARVALGADTGEPAALLWAQSILDDFGIEPVMDGVSRWPGLLRRCAPLRTALLDDERLDPETALALGLRIDTLIEQLASARDFTTAMQAGTDLQLAVGTYSGQAPDAALVALDRLLLATGGANNALAIRLARQRQRPELASRAADLVVLLRLLGEQASADRVLAGIQQRADAAAALYAVPDPDLVGALFRLGDEARVAELFAAADATTDTPQSRALRFRWLASRGDDARAWRLAQALWESGTQADRWMVLSQTPGLDGNAERRAILDEQLDTLPIDPAERHLLRLALLERAEDGPDAATLFAEPFPDDTTNSRLWQWRLLAHLEQEGHLEATLDAATDEARSGAWFAQLNEPDTLAALRRAAGDPRTAAATRAALTADRPAAEAIRVLARIADTAPADPTNATPSPDRALAAAVAEVHAFPGVELAFAQSPAADPSAVLDRLGLLLIEHRLPPQLGREIIALCARSGDLTRANHYGTLLAATDDAADDTTLLTVATLRAAAGATEPATRLAQQLAQRGHPGLDQPAYATDLAAIFIEGARFPDARQLVLDRIGQNPGWRNAALTLLPRLTAHPAELANWIDVLAPTLAPGDAAAWVQVAQTASNSHDLTGNTAPVLAARRGLRPVVASLDEVNDTTRPLIACEGLLAQISGDYAAMQVAYDRLLAANPNDPSTLNNYADGLVTMGQRLDDAQRMAESAEAILPASPQIQDTLARIDEALGNAEAARAHARRADELEPRNLRWATNLLALSLRQGDLGAARAVLNDINDRLDPDALPPLEPAPQVSRDLERLTEVLQREESKPVLITPRARRTGSAPAPAP